MIDEEEHDVVDLAEHRVRLEEHARQLVGQLGHDGGCQRIARAKVLVGRGAVDARSLGDFRDRESLGSPLGQDQPRRIENASPVVLEVAAAGSGRRPGDSQHASRR